VPLVILVGCIGPTEGSRNAIILILVRRQVVLQEEVAMWTYENYFVGVCAASDRMMAKKAKVLLAAVMNMVILDRNRSLY